MVCLGCDKEFENLVMDTWCEDCAVYLKDNPQAVGVSFGMEGIDAYVRPLGVHTLESTHNVRISVAMANTHYTGHRATYVCREIGGKILFSGDLDATLDFAADYVRTLYADAIASAYDARYDTWQRLAVIYAARKDLSNAVRSRQGEPELLAEQTPEQDAEQTPKLAQRRK